MIEAKPRFYNERYYRSTLESQWAKMFDLYGAKYQYEPRLFNTRHGPYLPDFFFYDLGIWVEVKPVQPSNSEWEKLCDVAAQVDSICMFLIGFDTSVTGALARSTKWKYAPRVKDLLEDNAPWSTTAQYESRLGIVNSMTERHTHSSGDSAMQVMMSFKNENELAEYNKMINQKWIERGAA